MWDCDFELRPRKTRCQTPILVEWHNVDLFNKPLRQCEMVFVNDPDWWRDCKRSQLLLVPCLAVVAIHLSIVFVYSASGRNIIWQMILRPKRIANSEFLVFVGVLFVAVERNNLLLCKMADLGSLLSRYGVLTPVSDCLVCLHEKSGLYEIVRPRHLILCWSA